MKISKESQMGDLVPLGPVNLREAIEQLLGLPPVGQVIEPEPVAEEE